MKKILIFAILFLIFGCDKIKFLNPKPTATINYVEYEDGKVSFSLDSKNVTSAVWTFENGQKENSLSPDFVYSKNGNYTVSCVIEGDGGSATITQSVQVKKVSGNIVFWTSTGNKTVEVTINGQTLSITSNYQNAPNCYSTGTATFKGPEGTYSFTAKEVAAIPAKWSGTVKISSGLCNSLKLNY